MHKTPTILVLLLAGCSGIAAAQAQSSRSYTVEEIDRMRDGICIKFTFHRSGPYRAADRAKEIEDQLRTYMLAGIDPDMLTRPSHVTGRCIP